mmetsp:Transcript_13835/g.22922  ORF Transcript_13835/g.22922 Transcript_13835/m.22922 type:complete len:915 (+) Transcript_13835:97-2841(+)
MTAQRWIWFVLINVVTIGNGIHSLHSWNSLFQSDARAHFQSDSALSAAHDSYATSIAHSQYKHSKRRHPFIVQFPADCGKDCHDALKSQVGAGRHSFLSASYAQVMVKTEEMGALQAQLGPSVVLDYAAMLPELKVERRTHAVSQQDTTCGLSEAGGSVFQAVLAPQKEASLGSVMAMLQRVVTDFTASTATGGGEVVKLRVDPGGLLANQENVVTFEVKCVSGSETAAAVRSEVLSQLVSSIASLPVVLWVEHREPFQASNRWASGLCQSGDAFSQPMFAAGLNGSGIVVGVSDTGIDMTHCQFYDENVSAPYDTIDQSHRKVVTYITFADGTDDSDGHGTHVASTVGGKSNIRYGDFIKYDGNAEEAKIAFFDIGWTETHSLITPGNLNSGMLQHLYDAGARISTHSWGSTASSYTSDARSVDSFMLNNDDALVLFAAGNDGISEGAASVGSPSTNKNGISVGASINSYDVMRAVMGADIDQSLYDDKSMAGFSSQGPTSDGRLKPDIAAPGWFTAAAKAIAGAANDHCDVKTLRGTSMASPAMAGNAALIQQYFKEGFYPSGSRNAADAFTPSGALLKAMLVHSGKNMDTVTYDDGTQQSTGGYPSYIQGYGKIRLSDVLNFGESTNDPITLFVKGDTNTASPMHASLSSTLVTHRYYIVAPSSPSSIRVTMTYTDQIGSAGSSRPLVNDLELRVKLNGDVYVPHFNSYSDINNIEMVDIDNPCAGCNFTIEVRAVSLSAVQPYALVATGIVTPFVFNATSDSSTDIDSSESIGPLTLRIIVVLGIISLILGSILIYLHYIDVPPPARKRKKNFAQEQHEQAEALRYYEEEHRKRQRQAAAGDNPGQPRERGRRGGGGGRGRGDESSVRSSSRSRQPSPDKKKKKKKKKRDGSDSDSLVELARQQQATARI